MQQDFYKGHSREQKSDKAEYLPSGFGYFMAENFGLCNRDNDPQNRSRDKGECRFAYSKCTLQSNADIS